MTDEIFRFDGYIFDFEAHVVSVDGDKVILDCTAFYPGGGGQVCDTGMIREFKVTEASYNKDGDIVHIVPGNDLKPGDLVWCSVDWDRRYGLMQGHTGEHLLFGSLQRQCEDLNIVKIFISPDVKYVIVDKDLTWEQIRAAEDFANKAIADNLSVTHSIMDRDDPELEKVRIKLDKIGEDEEITVVAIGDIDYSACSGVHVLETSELGMLIVDRKVKAGKDGYEIHFKVGEDAKRSAIALSNIALETIDIIGCKNEDTAKAVANMKQDLELKNRLLKDATKQIVANLHPKDVGGTAVYSAIIPGADRNVMNDTMESIRSNGGVGAFVSVSETLSVMLASGNGKVDCRTILSEVLGAFGGRGGGKPNFAQGGVQDASKSEEVLKALVSAVEKAIL
ncbi:MAG: alanyl-tRNA editing protein [Thermoplasmata archaeon]|nr:alanyl-tRNA editing protein [Thermoplasmata archaeon]